MYGRCELLPYIRDAFRIVARGKKEDGLMNLARDVLRGRRAA